MVLVININYKLSNLCYTVTTHFLEKWIIRWSLITPPPLRDFHEKLPKNVSKCTWLIRWTERSLGKKETWITKKRAKKAENYRISRRKWLKIFAIVLIYHKYVIFNVSNNWKKNRTVISITVVISIDIIFRCIKIAANVVDKKLNIDIDAYLDFELFWDKDGNVRLTYSPNTF